MSDLGLPLDMAVHFCSHLSVVISVYACFVSASLTPLFHRRFYFRSQGGILARTSVAEALTIRHVCVIQSVTIFWVLQSGYLFLFVLDGSFIHLEVPNKATDSVTDINSLLQSVHLGSCMLWRVVALLIFKLLLNICPNKLPSILYDLLSWPVDNLDKIDWPYFFL